MNALLQRFNVEQLRLLLGCSCVIAVAGMFVYGILPELRTQRASAAQMDQARQTLAQRAVTEADVAALTSDVAALRKALEGNLSVPPRQAEAALLRYLHRQAALTGLRLVRVAPQRAQRADGVLVLQFQVEAVGTYSSSAQWLEALDSPDSMAVLSEFSLAPEGRAGATLRLRASIAAYRYLGDSA
ncbi:MAG: type 4a pilus biogenesis protein PilO [Pseudomonadales bacterium]